MTHDNPRPPFCAKEVPGALNANYVDIYDADNAYMITDLRRPVADIVLPAVNERAALQKCAEALRDADACIQEEINYSNYDHTTVCRIGAMWDEAHGIIQAALAAYDAVKE